jgi:hypothetical protein
VRRGKKEFEEAVGDDNAEEEKWCNVHNRYHIVTIGGSPNTL